MGEMVSINIGSNDSYEFISYKNTFGDLLMFFSELDLRIDKEEIDGEIDTRRYFSTSVVKAKKCLDIMGYTISKSKDTFEKNKCDRIEWMREYGIEEWSKREKDEFTYEKWYAAVH